MLFASYCHELERSLEKWVICSLYGDQRSFQLAQSRVLYANLLRRVMNLCVLLKRFMHKPSFKLAPTMVAER